MKFYSNSNFVQRTHGVRGRCVTLLLALGLFAAMLGGGSNVASAANDTLTVKTVGGFSTCYWNVTAKNRNSAALAINKIRFDIQTIDGTQFDDNANAPNQTWDAAPTSDHLSLIYTATGSSIPAGGSLAGFGMSFSWQTYGSPVTVAWTTFNNGNVINTGSFRLICTEFQANGVFDSASVVSGTSGVDPLFRFKMFSKNAANIPLDRVSFELLDKTAGYMRPSKIKPPTGWVTDSVTGYFAYFHATTSTTTIDIGSSLDSFYVSLYANPQFQTVNFVWRAYGGGSFVDRDTLRNVTSTVGSNPSVGTDVVTPTNKFGCLYQLKLQNFHVTNLNPPSPIFGMKVWSMTPGVTFSSAPSAPANWGKSVKPDTAIFLAASDPDAIPGGVTDPNFQVSVNNASGNAFTLHWQTLKKNNTELGSGDLTLMCSVGSAATDSVVVSDGTGACAYKLHVENKHNNPPSSVYGISLSITDGSGTFDVNKFVSSLQWPFTAPDNKSVRFLVDASSTNSQASGSAQDLLFAVVPTVAGQTVHVEWATYDDKTVKISGDKFGVTCTAVNNSCDTTFYTTDNASTCSQNFTVQNRRSTEVTKITIFALNGWKYDTATAPLGWTTTIAPSKLFVTYSSSQGLPPNVPQSGFKASYSGQHSSDTFRVAIQTLNTDGNSCYDTLIVHCTNSAVGSSFTIASGLKVSVSPNPFTKSANAQLQLPTSGTINVTLVDLLGRVQQSVASGYYSAGRHDLKIDAKDLAPGVYYLRVEGAVGRATRKIVISK
jgi:hypothetical protein